MPSPFPGMDPYIEAQEWTDFYAAYMAVLREDLTRELRPNYTARIERRVYVESLGAKETIVPDITIVEWTGSAAAPSGVSVAPASPTATIEPVVCPLPQPIEHRESFLVIRNRETQRVVTVIELLSPANKRPGPGRDLYLEKRMEVLASRTNLIELDLLRGGQRLPMAAPLPPGDYLALVCRSRRTSADVYAWRLEHRLPTIPIPLDQGVADVPLDLQLAFDKTFDRAAYNDTLNYTEPLTPELSEQERNLKRPE
jgi:hypothetical protein